MRGLMLKLCTFVMGIATIAPNACRGSWYQPEEPEGLQNFLKKGIVEQDS